MKKKKKQNITIAVIAIAIVAGIIFYNYSAEQTRQKGFVFGTELEKIQNDVKDLQTQFYSKFEKIILRYDSLVPPESFESAVDLLKLSSETQLDSDKQYIEWMRTGDDSYKVRSDSQYQQSLEYEMNGLVEYYSAKTGVKP